MKFVFRIVTLAALPFAGAFAESLLKIAGEDPIPVRREIFGVNQLAYGDGYGLVEPGTHTVVPELIQLLRESGLRAQRYPAVAEAPTTSTGRWPPDWRGKSRRWGFWSF